MYTDDDDIDDDATAQLNIISWPLAQIRQKGTPDTVSVISLLTKVIVLMGQIWT